MSTKAAALLGACVIIAALILALVPRPAEVAPERRGASVPRYQVTQANDNNLVVLDTHTGRMWRKFIPSNEGPSDWSEVRGPWLATMPPQK